MTLRLHVPRSRSLSLRARFTLIAAGMLLLPTVLVLSYIVVRERTMALVNAKQELAFVAQVQSAAIQSRIDALTAEVLLLATAAPVPSIDNLTVSAITQSEIEQFIAKHDRIWRSVEVYRRDGRLLGAFGPHIPDPPARPDASPWFLGAVHVAAIRGQHVPVYIAVSEGDEPRFEFATMLCDNAGSTTGVLRITADIDTVLAEFIRGGLQDWSLVDKVSNRLIAGDTTGRLTKRLNAIRPALVGSSGVLDAVTENLLIGYAQVRPQGQASLACRLLLFQDRRAVVAPAERTISVVIAATVVGSLVALVLAWFLAARIAEPVMSLARLAAQIASGEYREVETGSLPSGGREVRELIAAMHGLQREVEQRDRSLTEQISLLDRSYHERERDQAEMEAVFEAITDAVISVNSQGRIQHANAVAASLCQAEGRELRGAMLGSVLTLRDADGQELTMEELFAADQRALVERRFAVGDGDLVHAITVFPMAGDGHVVVLRDASDLDRLELRLRQGERLETVGRMAGGIAHDFNNLLAGMNSYAELLGRKHAEDAESVRQVAAIQKAIQRASSLVQDLLVFSRRQPNRKVVTDVADLFAECKGLLRAAIGSGVRLDIEAVLPGLHVLVDRAQLESALLNLGLNAADAMDGDGLITLRAAKVESKTTSEDLVPCVCLEVCDTGAGIEPSVLPHIFEPFFTTKPVGHGTGLGLSSVYGCVLEHEGRIEVESNPGEGSCFRLYLPLVEDASEVSGKVEALPPQALSSRRILLADDEDVVRESVAEMLEYEGAEVVTATDGNEALALVAQQSFDALVLDYAMPQKTGAAVLAELREAGNQVPVFLMSGYLTDEVWTELEQHGVNGVVGKPFTVEKLVGIILAGLAPAEEQPDRV